MAALEVAEKMSMKRGSKFLSSMSAIAGSPDAKSVIAVGVFWSDGDNDWMIPPSTGGWSLSSWGRGSSSRSLKL